MAITMYLSRVSCIPLLLGERSVFGRLGEQILTDDQLCTFESPFCAQYLGGTFAVAASCVVTSWARC